MLGSLRKNTHHNRVPTIRYHPLKGVAPMDPITCAMGANRVQQGARHPMVPINTLGNGERTSEQRRPMDPITELYITDEGQRPLDPIDNNRE